MSDLDGGFDAGRVRENLAAVRDGIDEAARGCGRDPTEVTLVAVSKLQPVEAIRAAYEAGHRDFGENYAQELHDKARVLADLPGLRWHFIGHLQRNKARLAAEVSALVQTVDSERLAAELDRQAARLGRIIPVLAQVNVGEEDQKSGCAPREAADLISAIEAAKGLRLEGLMTIPPWELEPEETRVYFRALARLREEHGGARRLPRLSMGMSHDFRVAIEEGATLVRVGTAVFGPRA